jgi:hypothetical protein
VLGAARQERLGAQFKSFAGLLRRLIQGRA